jgi:ATP-dependent Lhr-like helicase
MPDTFDAIRREPEIAGAEASRAHPVAPRRRRHRVPATLSPMGRWSVVPGEGSGNDDERVGTRALLVLARYGVVSRELARGDWTSLRHALLNMEYAGDVIRGYFVEGLSGEQYALPDAVSTLERRRSAGPHVLVSAADPANLWGPVLPLARRDGTRVSVARPFHAWVLLRAGTPVLLAEGHGRELTTLAAWDAADAPGVARALRSVMERPAATRPLRRLEIGSLDGAPILGTDAAGAFVAAGFVVDGIRLTCDRRVALEAREGARVAGEPGDA